MIQKEEGSEKSYTALCIRYNISNISCYVNTKRLQNPNENFKKLRRKHIITSPNIKRKIFPRHNKTVKQLLLGPRV